MRILIAIDGSPSSRIVLHQMATRPWPEGTVLSVVTVVDPFRYAEVSGLLPAATKSAQKVVEEAEIQLRSSRKQVSATVIQGHPTASIVKEAENWKPDLVVVGSHGLGRVRRLLLGSTAHAVVRKAPCSVEIVRALPEDQQDSWKQGLRILLATDGSDYSVAAARSIAGCPWPAESRVQVLSVPEFVVAAVDTGYLNPEPLETLRQSALSKAREAVGKALGIVKEAGLQAAGVVPMPIESPEVAILDEAKKWGAHLIVVGSHGRRGFDRYLMGSVSEAVAMHAQSSVEVVRLRQNKTGKEKSDER